MRVACPDCQALVVHDCKKADALRAALVDLLTWVPETGLASSQLEAALVEAGKEDRWISREEDGRALFAEPFFGTQSWSYPLFGSKDTARSFHGLLDAVVRAAGLDAKKLMEPYWKEREAKRLHALEREEHQRKRAEKIAWLKNEAIPLEERRACLEEILLPKTNRLIPFATPADRADDLGFDYLARYLETYWGGGISKEENEALIERLEKRAFNSF